MSSELFELITKHFHEINDIITRYSVSDDCDFSRQLYTEKKYNNFKKIFSKIYIYKYFF